MDFVNFLVENAEVLLAALAALLLVAALVAKVTPNTTDDVAVSYASKAVSALLDFVRGRKAVAKVTNPVTAVVDKVTSAVRG